MHDIECRRVFDRVFWFVGVKAFVFSVNVLVESGCGFRATLKLNNREGTEERTEDVAESGEGVISSLRHDNATCLSGAV